MPKAVIRRSYRNYEKIQTSLSEKVHEAIGCLTPRIEELAEGWPEVIDVDKVHGIVTVKFLEEDCIDAESP